MVIHSVLYHLVQLCVLSLVSPFKGPRNLQTSEPSKTSFRVTWDHAPGDVKGYKVTFHPVGEDIDLGELLVGPYDNTVVLEELRCVSGWFLIFILIVIWTIFSSISCKNKYTSENHLFFWSTELVPNTQSVCLVCLMEERVCLWLERRKQLYLMHLNHLLLRHQVKFIEYSSVKPRRISHTIPSKE